jgi:exopolysaccharide biosynthesis polyprenyl glycosylphosphotransferase
MLTNVVLQRALVPFAFAGTLMIGLSHSVPELRTAFASSLLAVTALLLVRPIARQIRSSSHFRTRVLLIGNRPIAQKFIEEIEANPNRGYTIVGLVPETSSRQMQFPPYLVLGTINELHTIVRSVRPDQIILALSDRRGRMPVTQLLEFQSNGIVVEDVADAYERLSGKLAIEAVTPGQLISSQGLRKPRALKATQRALSFAAALVLLVVLAPILGLIALVIQLDSGGPVLFRQMRLGKGGRPFKLIKFRTMQPVDNPTSEWAQDNLRRITRVGRWLRRLRLDELPQLVNVIRGDMNLVGPRPHPVCNVKLFREAIPYYVLRSSVLPGITGWAQTRYRYANNLEQETEKMRYDLYYIKHMSLWMDLRIILDTCGKFLSGFTSSQTEASPQTRPVFQREPAHMPAAWRPKQPAEAPVLPHLQYASDSESRPAAHAP